MTVSEPIYAEPIERLCGSSREKGGTYLELGFSEHGKTIEKFLFCPNEKFDQEKFNLSPRGVTLIKVDGVFHVLDWIGAIYYPNVADFLEEIRRFGLSRRLELSEKDYAKLTPESRLVCIHPAGFIEDTLPYWQNRIGMDDPFFEPYNWANCPIGIDDHLMTQSGAMQTLSMNFSKLGLKQSLPMCMGLWYEDCMFVEPIAQGDRRGFVKNPNFKYRCASPPAGERSNSPGIIGSFPIGRIVVVEDPENSKHESKIKKLESLHDDLKVEVVKA